MINKDEANALAIRLHGQTESGLIKWKKTANEAYLTSFSSSSIRVFRNGSEGSYGITIINSDGEGVGTFGSRGESGIYFDLYKIIDRKTSKIDETMKNIWDSLGGR